MKEESYIDRMVRRTWERFDKSKLKPIFDNLGLKKGSGGYTIGGDFGYLSLKLYSPKVEIQACDNGKIFVRFGYDDNVGAWGGYTRKCEVKDTDIFKDPKWFSIVKRNAVKANPDVIMI